MATLIKNQAITFIPGFPGFPGYPGRPAQSARTYTTTVRVCSYTSSNESEIRDSLSNQSGAIGSGSGERVTPGGKRCTDQRVTVYVPAQEAIAPIPSIPGTPSQIITNFKIGWNGRARSIDSMKAAGRFSFSIPVSDVGAIVGLSRSPQEEGFRDILHGFYVAHGVIRIYESGVEVLYVGGIPNAEFSITRTYGTVEYRVNGTVVRTTTASSGTVYLAASLYAGGDSVNSYSLETWGEASIDSSARPMQGYMGTEDYGVVIGSMRPMTGTMGNIRRAQIGMTFRPLSGNMSDGTGYCQITSSMPAMTSDLYGFGLEPEYSVAAGFTLPMQMSINCLTGRIASIDSTTLPMTGVASDRPYAEMRMVTPPMRFYSESYLTPGQGVLLSYVGGRARLNTLTTMFAIIDANMQVTGFMQVQTLASGSIPASLSASAEFDVQTAVQAFIQSLMRPSAGAFQQAGDPMTVWALNMDVNGSTRYEGYDFNSFAELDGLYYGVKYDGLYLLEGPDDNGTDVDSSVNFGNLNFGSIARKALPYLYCGVASNGNLIIRVEADGQTFFYDVRDNTELLKAHRFELGKGLRASYYDVTLMSEGGTAFDLAEIEFFPLELSRKL